MGEKSNLLQFVENIFPQKTIPVGSGTVTLKAMPFGTIVSVITQLKEFGGRLKEQGVTWDNYQEQKQSVIMAVTLAQEFPSLLSEMTNIELESINALPLDVLVEIVSGTVEVNLKSKDNFLKNFKGLTENLQKMMSTKEIKDNLKKVSSKK